MPSPSVHLPVQMGKPRQGWRAGSESPQGPARRAAGSSRLPLSQAGTDMLRAREQHGVRRCRRFGSQRVGP